MTVNATSYTAVQCPNLWKGEIAQYNKSVWEFLRISSRNVRCVYQNGWKLIPYALNSFNLLCYLGNESERFTLPLLSYRLFDTLDCWLCFWYQDSRAYQDCWTNSILGAQTTVYRFQTESILTGVLFLPPLSRLISFLVLLEDLECLLAEPPAAPLGE